MKMRGNHVQFISPGSINSFSGAKHGFETEYGIEKNVPLSSTNDN